jgi:hypothetical protein
MKRTGNAANPARFPRPLHFAVEKHVAYRTENGALYGRRTECLPSALLGVLSLDSLIFAISN